MYKFVFTGKGFIRGLPARDITEDEAAQIGIRRILKSGAYERVKEPKKEPVKATEQKEGE